MFNWLSRIRRRGPVAERSADESAARRTGGRVRLWLVRWRDGRLTMFSWPASSQADESDEESRRLRGGALGRWSRCIPAEGPRLVGVAWGLRFEVSLEGRDQDAPPLWFRFGCGDARFRWSATLGQESGPEPVPDPEAGPTSLWAWTGPDRNVVFFDEPEAEPARRRLEADGTVVRSLLGVDHLELHLDPAPDLAPVAYLVRWNGREVAWSRPARTREAPPPTRGGSLPMESLLPLPQWCETERIRKRRPDRHIIRAPGLPQDDPIRR